MARILLLLPNTSYRIPDLLDAAAKLGVEVVVASDEASTLEAVNPAGLLSLDFQDPAACARRVADFARERPLDAVLGVDEDTVVAAAAIAAQLRLRHNSIDAARAAGSKALMRDRLASAGLPVPAHRLFSLSDDSARAVREVSFPCVLKPTFLSGSRGVIRANDAAEFLAAWERIGRVLAEPDVAKRGGARAREVLVEDFVPGAEVALEGLLRGGRLRMLALFDKPNPLDGPYFEETIYVTPSRLAADTQRRIVDTAARAAAALGLSDGPIHAEMRVNDSGVWVLEVAARSIGGLCSRTLRFGTGMSLEELILRHALGEEVENLTRETRAAGVMMIPIPRAGVLESVAGLEEARGVAGIEDVTISARAGQRLVPLPEGSRYLGFIFARADSPAEVEGALRRAHAALRFVVRD